MTPTKTINQIKISEEKEKKFLRYFLNVDNWRPPIWKNAKKAVGLASDNSILRTIQQVKEKTGVDVRTLSAQDAKNFLIIYNP